MPPVKPAYLQMCFDDVRILVLGSRMLSDEEFDAHIAEAKAMGKSVRAVLLVIKGSPEMSAARRAKLAQAGLLDVPTAVLTESTVIRAILTGLNWIGGKARPFPIGGVLEACDFLGVAAASRAPIAVHVASMTAAVTTLDEPHPSDAGGSLVASAERVRASVVARMAKMRGPIDKGSRG